MWRAGVTPLGWKMRLRRRVETPSASATRSVLSPGSDRCRSMGARAMVSREDMAGRAEGPPSLGAASVRTRSSTSA